MPTLHGLLKRIGANSIVISIGMPLVSALCMKPKLMDEKEASQVLNDYYPDQGFSAILSQKRIFEKEEYDVAVIIPCYKAENTIENCLTSCIEQRTEASFKIIAVDDGSPDTTGDILDRYAKKSEKLYVIHQKNGGAAAARNAAMDIARSKYFMFVDADDFIPQNAIEALYRAAETEDAYIVQGDFSKVDSFGKVIGVERTRGGVFKPSVGFKRFALWQVIQTRVL